MAGLPTLRVHEELERLGRDGLPWLEFTAAISEPLTHLLGFDAFCWHTVDPGTILFTGSLNRGVGCSGSWLAHYEYVVEDVDKWSFLARSGRIAGATSITTHGDLSRSARHRSQQTFGFGDELRVALVAGGVYWGAAAFLRQQDRPWFTEADVRAVAELAPTIAAGLRRAVLAPATKAAEATMDHGPGVVVFDDDGHPESISGAARCWIAEMIEEPPPSQPEESKMVQAIATRARDIPPGTDPLELAARARVRTRNGVWLLLYGTRLTGGRGRRTAVIMHPATPQDVAPVIALSYGLTTRECQVAMQCIRGSDTRGIARTLSLSPHTVQDYLKSIFAKTGVHSRGELVGQIFLDHYATRWEPASVETPVSAVWELSRPPTVDHDEPSRPSTHTST